MSDQPIYARRIHIECDPKMPCGMTVKLTDVETGKPIEQVAAIVIYLKPTETNECCLTYWLADEDGRIVLRDDEIVERKAIVDNPQIDLVAYERQDQAEYIRRKYDRG